MEYMLQYAFNGSAAAAVAGNYSNIRLIYVSPIAYPVPYDMWTSNPILNTTYIRWNVASTNAVKSFSAVCWWNAVHMSNELNNSVPIGLIGNYWGGTAIESWSSPRVCNASGCIGRPFGTVYQSTIFNTMVYPFIPMALKSMYWYQGETNAGTPDYYKCILPKFVEDYRTRFNSSDMPFIFVQLAPINYTGDFWPKFRAMQYDASLLIDNSCLVSTTDLGDIESGGGSIHPRIKEPIGYRAYLCTQRLVYGKSGVWNGPLPKCATASNDTNEITVSFIKDTIGDSLVFNEPYCPEKYNQSCGLPWSVFNGTAWYNSTFTMSDDKTQVILNGDYIISNRSFVQIRHAWGAYSQATLFNTANVASPVFVIKLSECPVDPPVEESPQSPTSTNTPSAAITSDAETGLLSLAVPSVLVYLATCVLQ